MRNLKDKIWIWGHPANSLKGNFGLTLDSHVSPVDGAKYLGANNVFYVPMCQQVDRIACNKEMTNVKKSVGVLKTSKIYMN